MVSKHAKKNENRLKRPVTTTSLIKGKEQLEVQAIGRIKGSLDGLINSSIVERNVQGKTINLGSLC